MRRRRQLILVFGRDRLARLSKLLDGSFVTLRCCFLVPLDRLSLVFERARSSLIEVADSVLCLGQAHIGSLDGPKVCFGVGLRQHAGRSDQVPGSQCEAGFPVVLLCSDVYERESVRRAPLKKDIRPTVVVYAQGRVFGTAHLAVFVAFAELVS